MAYIIGKRSYARETYPEPRQSGSSDTGPTGPAGATGPAGPSIFATETRSNKAMIANATVADGDLACAIAVAQTPAESSASGGYVFVDVDGVLITPGDGTKVAVPCYFSGDGGATARAMASIIMGDFCYWNGSVAGFQLAASDLISFIFPVNT